MMAFWLASMGLLLQRTMLMVRVDAARLTEVVLRFLSMPMRSSEMVLAFQKFKIELRLQPVSAGIKVFVSCSEEDKTCPVCY